MPAAQPWVQEDGHTLMLAVAEGNKEAFAVLYDRYSAISLGITLRVLRDRSEAEAVMLDVFWEIWRHASRFNPERGAPLVYIQILSRSRALDKLHTLARRRERERSGDVAGWSDDEAFACGKTPAPDRAAISTELHAKVDKVLHTLNRSQHSVLHLWLYEGLSHHEIAHRLQRPLGTVKSAIRLGLTHVRAAMG